MSAKARVVFDTGVLISAALKETSLPFKAFEKAAKQFALIASYSVLAEYIEVFSRKKFDAYASQAARDAFIANVKTNLELIPVTSRFTICHDPDDNKFLDLAVQGNAHYIVSGDDDLLMLDPFQHIRILSPAGFMAVNP